MNKRWCLMILNKQKLIIIGLSAGLIFFIINFGLDILVESRQEEILDYYQQGFDAGVTEAVTLLFAQTENCEITSLTMGNDSKFLIDYSCLENNFPKSINP